MRLTTTLAAALVAAAVPLYAGPAAAAPLSQSLALNGANVGTVEQVQYRRWNRGRWIGPAAGVAAGIATRQRAGAASTMMMDTMPTVRRLDMWSPATPTARPPATSWHLGTPTVLGRGFARRNMAPAPVTGTTTAHFQAGHVASLTERT